MNANEAFVKKPLIPYRSATHPLLASVPPAPRELSSRARQIVFGIFPRWRFWGSSLFCGVGILFSAVFGHELPLEIALDLWGIPTTGTVIRSAVDDHATINDRHPTLIHFRYRDGKREYEATSSSLDDDITRKAAPGAAVRVEMLAGHPGAARVADTTRAPFGVISGLLPLLFVAFGAWDLVRTQRFRHRARRSFVHGVACVATVTRADVDHSTEINGVHPFEVAWQFSTPSGPYRGSIKHKDPSLLTALIAVGTIVVLHDPERPWINTVWVPDTPET
jgi:hypothetical protein